MAGRAVGVHSLLDSGDKSLAYADSIHSEVNFVLICKLPGKPLIYRDLFRNAHFVQLHAGPLKLLHRLDEVAGIGPKSGVVQSNYHVACFTGESGEPLYALPALCGILASVRIRPCHDYGIPSAAAHHRPEPCYPVCIDVFHNHKCNNFR